ncbi:unnamed protein product [Discula destructiva]
MNAAFETIATGVFRNGVLSSRAPSPPYVHVPTVTNPTDPSNTINPSYNLVAPGQLSVNDIDTITGGRPQTTHNPRLTDDWCYEDRRKAQAILDFLYLGPLSVVRDHAWLQKHGITMLLVARTASMAGMRSLSIERAVAELGVELKYVDLAINQELIRNFPSSVDLINEHLLRFNTAASQNPAARQGKVLVLCETGNDRSAAIVTAYVMAMYGREAIGAIQFVSCQRFCTNFDEATKHLLMSYEDLLKAKRITTLAIQQATAVPAQQGYDAAKFGTTKKRRIDATLDADEDGDLDMDTARYQDRAHFAPFLEGHMDS